MGMEKRILNMVEDVLECPRCAEFTNGTLFVHCDEHQADAIVRNIVEQFNIGRIKVSKMGTEYAFDFV